jgi:nucleoside-diphosphate-sugar epimerase
MARYCVTGGSGFLGINLVRFLLARGEQVTVLDLEPFSYPEANRVTFCQGDVRVRAAVARAVAGADVVVHSAAALPLYSPEDIFSTEVEGTRVVLEESRRAGAKRVVHVSSTAVYGVPDHHPLLETDALIGVGPYGKAKIEAERLCEEFRREGMCVPVLRPKSFIGPERLGVFALLYEWAFEGRNFPLLGSGKNRYQLLDVEDLCEAIYLCATGDAAVANDTFNVGAAEFETMREDYQAVLDEAGHGKKIVGLPLGPSIFILRVLEALRISPLYAWVYETAGKDSWVSIEKLQKTLGWQPRYSNRQALIRNYRWYAANRDSFKNQSGVSHRVPWKEGALSLAKRFF